MTERDELLDDVVDILREPAHLSPDLTQRIMETVASLPAHGVAAPRLRWWRREWTVRLTPLHALGLAAVLAGLVFWSALSGRRPQVAPGQTLTQFVFIAPGAAAVTVVGDFNDWNLSATPLARAGGDGMWWVTLPLGPGRYRYAFVVDGNVWRVDPEAPAADDEFGRPNSVVTVGGP